MLEDLNELQVSKPVSYHAVKNTALLNGLHNKILSKKISQLIKETSKLRCEVDAMMALIDMQHVSNTVTEDNLDIPFPALLICYNFDETVDLMNYG